MEDSLAELQKVLNSLIPKPTELDLEIEATGRAHEIYLSFLNQIEKSVKAHPIESRHAVCDIVIEWLTRKTSESWAKCSAALRKSYKKKKYHPIGFSPIGE